MKNLATALLAISLTVGSGFTTLALADCGGEDCKCAKSGEGGASCDHKHEHKGKQHAHAKGMKCDCEKMKGEKKKPEAGAPAAEVKSGT